MSIVQAQKSAHFVLIGLFLLSLPSVGHFTWAETARLAVVVGCLIWAFFHYRDRLDLPANEPGAVHKGAAMILALTVAFAVTQFDPATSTIGQRERLPHFSGAYLLGLVCSVGLLLLALFSPVRWALRLSQWDRVDRIVLGVTGGVFAVSVLSQKIVDGRFDPDTVFGAAKVLSYGCLWLGVTRLYGGKTWEPSGPGFTGLILDRWRGALVAILVLFLPALVYGTGRVGLVLYHNGQGQDAYAREDYDAAKAYYEKAEEWNNTTRLDSVSDRYLADLATLYFREGDDVAGKKAIGSIRGHTLDPAESNIKEADIYVRAERWADAARLYERVIVARGKDTATLDRLGMAYLELGDSRNFLRISEEFDHVPDVSAESFDEVIFIGNVHFYRERFGDALDQYERSVQLRPEDSYAIYKVGRAQMAQGQFDRAIESFERAVALEPEFADAHYRIGECLEARGDTAGALGKYEETVALLPNHLDGMLARQRLSGGEAPLRGGESGRAGD